METFSAELYSYELFLMVAWSIIGDSSLHSYSVSVSICLSLFVICDNLIEDNMHGKNGRKFNWGFALVYDQVELILLCCWCMWDYSDNKSCVIMTRNSIPISLLFLNNPSYLHSAASCENNS